MVEGKKKGNRAERKIARNLSAWLRDGPNPELEADDIDNPDLWLSKLSGGWQFRDTGDVGDLQPNNERGAEFRAHFGVEVKHYKEIDWWELFTHSEPDINEWWDKHWAECREYQLCPLLIMRANYRPWLVGHPMDLYDELDSTTRLIIPSRGIRFVQYNRWIQFDPRDTYNWYERWRKERFGRGD